MFLFSNRPIDSSYSSKVPQFFILAFILVFSKMTFKDKFIKRIIFIFLTFFFTNNPFLKHVPSKQMVYKLEVVDLPELLW